jgi:hypothetical protein
MNMRLTFFLILLTGICLGIILRPLFEPQPARAVAMGGGMPMSPVVQIASPPLLSTTNGIAYVVSDGKISAYEVREHTLVQSGNSIAIPAAPPSERASFTGAQ